MMDNLDNLDTGHAGAGLSNDAGLAVDEAAAHAGVSDRTIRRALKARPGDAGHLPSWRVKGPRGSEYRISLAALDEWMGRRDALDSDTTNTGQTGTLDSQARLARGASQASQADTLVQSAAVQVIIEQLLAPVVEANERLADANERLATEKGQAEGERDILRQQLADRENQAHDLVGELRRRAEVAEREAAELRRARRQMPWWLRLLVGGR